MKMSEKCACSFVKRTMTVYSGGFYSSDLGKFVKKLDEKAFSFGKKEQLNNPLSSGKLKRKTNKTCLYPMDL